MKRPNKRQTAQPRRASPAGRDASGTPAESTPQRSTAGAQPKTKTAILAERWLPLLNLLLTAVIGVALPLLLARSDRNVQKELEEFKASLKRPALEYLYGLGANPADESAPDVIMETIEIHSVGRDTALNVLLRVQPGMPIPEDANVGFPYQDIPIEYSPNRDALQLIFSKLQVNDFVVVDVPLRREDILRAGSLDDFFEKQVLIVTCDGGPEVQGRRVTVAETTPPPRTHVVKAGESLFSIAKAYHTSVAAILELNGVQAANIKVGQPLLIP